MGLSLGNRSGWVFDPGMGPDGHPDPLGMILYPGDGPQGCPEAPGMSFDLSGSRGTIPGAREIPSCCLFGLLPLLLPLAQAPVSLLEPVTINFSNSIADLHTGPPDPWGLAPLLPSPGTLCRDCTPALVPPCSSSLCHSLSLSFSFQFCSLSPFPWLCFLIKAQ